MNEFENQNNNSGNGANEPILPETEDVKPDAAEQPSYAQPQNNAADIPEPVVFSQPQDAGQEQTWSEEQQSEPVPPASSEPAADFSAGQNTAGNNQYGQPFYQSQGIPVRPPFENNGCGNSQMPPVNYAPVVPAARKSCSKGLRIFCLALAALILLTGTAFAGYLYGKNGSYGSVVGGSNKRVEVNLAEKPKNTDEYTAGEVYEKLNESIVGICVYNANGEASSATGVIYSEDGYVITNDHIYSKISAPKFRVYMSDGSEHTAEYVAGDTVSDLAVLKIKDNISFKPAQLGNSDELYCGETVVALGRPGGASDSTSITKGTVSMTARRVSITTNYSSRMIQTDSAINPGSSGGALVNMYGQVVGITSSKQSGSNYEAVGFAIPTVTVKRVVTQLISDGKVTDRAKLGITYKELNSVSAELSGSNAVGIYVASVSSDSDLYGKVKEGDVITKINGVDITNDDIVLDVIDNSAAGDTITVTVVSSDNSTAEYTAKLGANVGESSYNPNLESKSSDNSDSSQSGGTFNFPFGE